MTALSGPVFIGGSGRSGTSYLHRKVREASGFAGVEAELRILVEAGGLADLIPAVSRRFSVSRARAAIQTFSVRVNQLCQTQNDAFGQAVLSAHAELTAALHWPSGVERALSDEEADAAAHNFARGLSGAVVVSQGSEPGTRFVEKTPHNSLHWSWLAHLYPDARFLEIGRDVRGVVWSLKDQTWAPDSVEGCSDWLESYFRARLRSEADKDEVTRSKILKLSLEQLVTDPQAAARNVCQHIEGDVEFDGVDPAQVMRWQDAMPIADQEYVLARLKRYSIELGLTA